MTNIFYDQFALPMLNNSPRQWKSCIYHNLNSSASRQVFSVALINLQDKYLLMQQTPKPEAQLPSLEPDLLEHSSL